MFFSQPKKQKDISSPLAAEGRGEEISHAAAGDVSEFESQISFTPRDATEVKEEEEEEVTLSIKTKFGDLEMREWTKERQNKALQALGTSLGLPPTALRVHTVRSGSVVCVDVCIVHVIFCQG